jgi:hypothetical protein
MALKSSLVLWSSIGDVNFNAAQAGAIGASFGNGAASFGQNSNNPLQMGDDGNLVIQTVSAGRIPAGTGSDYVLAVATIPAGGFDIANRGVSIMAAGLCAGTGDSKAIKIIVGATAPAVGSVVSGGSTIASILADTTGVGGWQLQANMFKYGAAGSNTQIAIHEAAQAGAVLSALVAPTLLTLPESGPITIAITGNATTAADITFNFLQIFAQN